MPKRWTPGSPRLTPRERAFYGVTATLVNVETRKQRTLVMDGTTMEAVARVIAWCDEHGPDWRVRCLSTPVSIHGDLQNQRRRRPQANYTESVLLGRARRTDLVERLRDDRGTKAMAENERRLGRRKR